LPGANWIADIMRLVDNDDATLSVPKIASGIEIVEIERSSAILLHHPVHPHSDGLLHTYGPHLSSLFVHPEPDPAPNFARGRESRHAAATGSCGSPKVCLLCIFNDFIKLPDARTADAIRRLRRFQSPLPNSVAAWISARARPSRASDQCGDGDAPAPPLLTGRETKRSAR